MKSLDVAAVDQAEWDRVKTRLKQEFGESAFKSWVTPITVAAFHKGEVELAVPTRFMRDWITTHYAERIRALWSGENPSVRKVTLKVEAARAAAEGRERLNAEVAAKESGGRQAAPQGMPRALAPASFGRIPPSAMISCTSDVYRRCQPNLSSERSGVGADR